MNNCINISCTAFEGHRRVGSGALAEVVLAAKQAIDLPKSGPILIFDDLTSEVIEIDFRGSPQEVLANLPPAPPETAAAAETPTLEAETARGPGRPKLGVVPREVTLLPRHWEWLGTQPGGASVALRKLVETARKANKEKDRLRKAQESAYRFISTMAGNLPDFEEATRALFAKDATRFEEWTQSWPPDVAAHARRLASAVFQNPGAAD